MVKLSAKFLTLFLFSALASATTTITGNVRDLGASTVSRVTLRFYLRGCAGNQPRVTGVGVLAPSQGSVWFKDFVSDAGGNISGTLYSTRDAAGTGNGEIECGGSYTSVWYGMQLIQSGKTGPEVPIAAKNGTTFDISNITPITTNPVVIAPTGDTTYARIDGGNQPFLGSVTPNGNGVLNLGASSNRWNLLANTIDVSGLATLSAGGALSGTFSGDHTLSGNITFSGTNTHSGAETFNGTATFNNTSTFNNGLTVPTGQIANVSGSIVIGQNLRAANPPQNVGGTTSQTATLKTGTGGGSYTTASLTSVVVDSTNLCYTVLIPTGWKLIVSASGTIGTLTAPVTAYADLTDNATCSTNNAGFLQEVTSVGPVTGATNPFSLNSIITGDGNTHNIALQFKTINASDSAVILNTSAATAPVMTFLLLPAN